MKDRRDRARQLHQELNLGADEGGLLSLFRAENLRHTLIAFLFAALHIWILVVGEENRLDGTELLGIVASVFLIHSLCGLYMAVYERELITDSRDFLFFQFLTLFLLLCAKILIISNSQSIVTQDRTSEAVTSAVSNWPIFLIPLPAVSAIFALGFDRRLAFVHAFFAALLIGLMFGVEEVSAGRANQIELNQTLFLTMAAGAGFMIFNISRTSSFRRMKLAGVYAGLGMVASIMVGKVLFEGVPLTGGRPQILEFSAAAVAGVMTGFFLSEFGVTIVERAFDVLMNVRLLELRDLNRPILRKFHLEAPGTFHHTQVVAQLTEAAAYAVGANGLLAYVGALYHDIGKIYKPEYFVENRPGGPSKHEELSPTLSTLIVISHVKDGIELAREIDLPERIIDFIPEHHGTQAVEYFYRKAVAEGEAIDREPFRYPGPKPQSKESAILLIADTLEAVSRTLDEPSPSRIRAVVHEITMKKLNDGQLDDSPLTMRDLKKIEESFFRFLSASLHQRIKYPADPDAKRELEEAGVEPAGEGEAESEAASDAPPGDSSEQEPTPETVAESKSRAESTSGEGRS